MEGRAVGHNFERDPPRDHPCQVWFNLVQRFREEDLNVILRPGELKRGYILKIITKLYVTRNDDTTSFCYKNLITILVVMRRRRWTVMIWNILRMLLTI